MDLDDEELKATRKMHGLDDKIKDNVKVDLLEKRMSKADEMFEKLGYVKHATGYLSPNMKELYGDKADRRICFWLRGTIEVYDFYDGSRDFTVEELQAINEKCKELGWIE